ncbi:hypothetical protein C8R45DRAFT_935232 [Mycena sanguinolenta]|nr:hypothetical protein C8R45DRAFT_935232 [Mycena sanguinolenta]
MLMKFLACGLTAMALVGATSFQSFDAAITSGIEAGNYYLVNLGKNETLFGAGKGKPVYTKSTPDAPGLLAQRKTQWKVQPGAVSNEYKFFNVGLNSSTSANNGRLYVSYGPLDLSLTHVVTPVEAKTDTFIITLPGYGTWGTHWDSYDKQTEVFFGTNTGSPEQLWKFIRIG